MARKWKLCQGDTREQCGIFTWHKNFQEMDSALVCFSNPFFILVANPSAYGLGTILTWEHKGYEKTAGYYNRSVGSAKRNYYHTRQEVLKVIKSIDHFYHYLNRRKLWPGQNIPLYNAVNNPSKEQTDWLVGCCTRGLDIPTLHTASVKSSSATQRTN